MNTTQDADVWEDRWSSYVNDLGRMRLSAVTLEDSERISYLQEELAALVTTIAEDWREQDEP